MESLPVPSGGDQDRGSAVLAMFWTELAICAFFTATKLYSRYRMKNFGLDDVFVVAAMVLFVGLASVETLTAEHGEFRHLLYMSRPQVSESLKMYRIQYPLAVMGQVFAKMSLAFLILRHVRSNDLWRKWALYSIVASSFIVGALISILGFVQCNPPKVFWEGPASELTEKCWNGKHIIDFGIFVGSFLALANFILAALPLTLLPHSSLNLTRTIGLGTVVTLGALAGIFASVKTAWLKKYTARTDFTWEAYNLAAWSSAELFLLILCACIPALDPLLAGKRTRSSEGSDTDSTDFEDKEDWVDGKMAVTSKVDAVH